MNLSDLVIILCRAGEPGNVGAVCRVMKNMGLFHLRLVAPGFSPSTFSTSSGITETKAQSPKSSLGDEAMLLARAVHAEDVWRDARFFDTLADATADCSLIVGTTRRRGRKRKNVTLEPRALTKWLVSRDNTAVPVALVFGNERTGLEDDELNFCNIASHIPVSDAFPSLNLSHAVQIYAYELFLAFGENAANPVKGEWVPVDQPSACKLTADITDVLANLGFYKQPGREEQTRFLRDLISRAGLTEREGRYLRDIFIKAARLAGK